MAKEVKPLILYQCPRCFDPFTSSQKLKIHMKKMHQETVSVCRSCPQTFNTLTELFLHAREIHNRKQRELKQNCKHACVYENCSYKTDNGGLMKHHIRSHSNFKPHVCDICKKTFSQKSNMKTHFNRHLADTVKFPCEVCDKVFHSYDIYLSHLGTREHELSVVMSAQDAKLKCMWCGVEFDTGDEVAAHSEICETPLRGTEIISCNKCHARMLPDADVIKSHIKMHRNELICPHCDGMVVFDDRSKLNFHITKVHRQHVNKKSVCRYCELIFNSIAERNTHVINEHADTRNRHVSRKVTGRMACSICQNFFANSQIIMQKHLAKEHFVDMDVDEQFYKQSQVPIAEPDTQIKARNRGRPRLNEQSLKLELALFPNIETVKSKKRGRPQKGAERHSPDSNREVRKRGRPKKIKLEPEYNEDWQDGVKVKLEQIDYNIDHIDNVYVNFEDVKNDYFKAENFMAEF